MTICTSTPTVSRRNNAFLRLFSVKFFSVLLLLLLGSGVSSATVWNYDFGTGTGTYNTSNSNSTTFLTGISTTPSGGGTYRVKMSNGKGGSFIVANPGTSLGTTSELQINACTTATNKFGVYDWTSPSTAAYVKFKLRTTSSGDGQLNISLGINTLANDNNGYTGVYAAALTSFTITYASGSISSVVRRNSGANTTITGSGFLKDVDQIVEIYANNSATSTTYSRSGNSNTLAAGTWDLWVDGAKTLAGAGTSSLATGTSLSGFAFFGENSTSNAAFMYIDDLEYSNALPVAASAPTVTSSAANSIGTTGATLNGNVTSDGGALISERGFVYKTTTGVAIGDNKTTVSGTTGTFTLTPTLNINTHYYFCAYAINSVGTTLSSEQNFWTLANAPSAPTVNNATSSSVDIAVNTNSNPSITEFAVQETVTGKYVQSDGTLSTLPVWQIATTWGTKTVSGLNPSTSYTFQVKARNGANMETAFSSTTSLSTSAGSSPNISLGSLAAFGSICTSTTIGPNDFTITGTNLTTDAVTVGALEGFTYSIDGTNYYSSLSISQLGGSFSQTIHVKFSPTTAKTYSGTIAVGGGGISPSVNCAASATGINTAPTVTSTSPATSITATTVTLSGNVTDGGCQTITGRGICYGASLNPDINGTKTTETGTTGVVSSDITSLSPNTLYHFRAYATSTAGTSYGSDVTFTTSNLPTPTATAATSVGTTGFTANWGAVSGATGYQLDIYSDASYLVDDFTDGDFTSSPVWSGNTSSYAIQTSSTLPLGTANTGATTDNSYLGSNASVANTALYLSSIETSEWRFSLGSGEFNPSTTNYFGIVLMSNSTFTDLSSDSFNGYYLKIGSAASNDGDKIELWRSANTTRTQVGVFTSSPVVGAGALKDGLNIRVTRNISGQFELFYSTGFTYGSTPSASAGTLTDNTYSSSSYFGPFTVFANTSAIRRVFIDNISFGSTTTVSGYNSLPLSGTSQAVTGLSPNTAYYYRVRATSANSTSANSNVVTALTAFNGTTNVSTLPVCSTCNITVASGGELTNNANADRTFNSITVAGGGKLTNPIGSTLRLTSLTLNSDGSGTGTYVDKGTSIITSATVNQTLGTDRNWYLSSPISAAGLPGADNIYYYDETVVSAVANDSWKTPTGNLVVGKGYIVNPTASVYDKITFNGALNTGDQTAVTLTRTAEKSSFVGFNLVGNPYPSYLNANALLNDASNTNILKTIWYRTNNGSGWSYPTFNAESGIGVPTDNLGLIPPMQAFWVRATANNVPFYFKNEMRIHNTSGGSIPIKAPAVAANQILRLKVAAGSVTDEAVVYFNPNAATGYDGYDSPKMVNGTKSTVPDMYTMEGTEQLIINGMNAIPTEIPLYIKANAATASQFSLSATQLSNFETDTKVYVKNNSTGEQKLISDGTIYTFEASAVAGTDPAFSVIIKAPGTVTDLATNNSAMLNVYANASGQITITTSSVNTNTESSVTVYNAIGQKLAYKQLKSTRTLIDMPYSAGVYVVTVLNGGQKITRKVILN